MIGGLFVGVTFGPPCPPSLLCRLPFLLLLLLLLLILFLILILLLILLPHVLFLAPAAQP